MRGCSVGPSIGWLVTAFAAQASPGGQTATAPVLTALLYDEIGVPAAILRDATQLAGSIYQRAGVRLVWATCRWRAGNRVVDSCGQRMYAAEVVITITRPTNGASLSVRTSALGLALVRNGDPGYYADIFYSHIRELAELGRVQPGVVLGYALAHEIGHLLLRSTGHSPQGLMRARWDRETRERAERGSLRFLPDEAKRIREEAAGRAASAGRPATRPAETDASLAK